MNVSVEFGCLRGFLLSRIHSFVHWFLAEGTRWRQVLYLVLGKFHGFALSREAEMKIVFPCAELAWLGSELTVYS